MYFFTILYLLASQWSGLHEVNPDQICGKWISPNRDFMVECYKANDDTYNTKMVWFKKLENKKRYNCEIPEDEWIGKDIVWGLTYNDNEWSGGELKDLKSCKTYDAYVTMSSIDSLTVTAFVVLRMLGEGMTFDRYFGKVPSLSEEISSF